MAIFTVGVLAFHGDVSEHVNATERAAKRLSLRVVTTPVRTRENMQGLDALIIPGGESTTLQKLCEREDMWEEIKKIKNIFGTCAGAILLARTIHHKAQDQETLELMDIEVARNAYGKQGESFEASLNTKVGRVHGVFIRAPKIIKIGKNVAVLAKHDVDIVACEEKKSDGYYLATSFHPEFTSTVFHEHFLKHSGQGTGEPVV